MRLQDITVTKILGWAQIIVSSIVIAGQVITLARHGIMDFQTLLLSTGMLSSGTQTVKDAPKLNGVHK